MLHQPQADFASMKKKHEADQFELGLLPDSKVRNEGAGEPWKKKERDRALDEYFAGANPKQLGIKYKGAPVAFLNSILNKLKSNYKDIYKDPENEHRPGKAERYEPVLRTSRKTLRFTENERDFIRAHQEKGIDAAITAKILCRDVEEIVTDKSKKRASDLKEIVPSLEVVLAFRYAFHVYEKKIISNKEYDALKFAEIEYGTGYAELKKSPKDCPHYIKTLALYLVEKYDAAAGS